MPMDLIRPALPYLASYCDALRRGWSPNNARNVAAEELRLIAGDAEGFVRGLTDKHSLATRDPRRRWASTGQVPQVGAPCKRRGTSLPHLPLTAWSALHGLCD